MKSAVRFTPGAYGSEPLPPFRPPPVPPAPSGPPAASATSPSTTPPAARTRGIPATAEVDLRSVRKPGLAVRDDALTLTDAGGDDRDAVGRAVDRNGALFGPVCRVDDVDKRSLLAPHHALRRHHEGVVLHKQAKRDGDELPHPQGPALVVELGLELNRTGRGVDGVVDEVERPIRARVRGVSRCGNGHRDGTGRRRSIDRRRCRHRRRRWRARRIRARPHRQTTVPAVAENQRELRPGHRKANDDRPHLVDEDERCIAARASQIAGPDEEAAGASREGSADRGVVEVELGGGQVGAVCLKRGTRRPGRGSHLIHLFDRNYVAGKELAVPLELRLGVGEVRKIARKCRLYLPEGGFIRTRIDLEQHLPLAHLLSFLKQDLLNDSVHLGHDGRTLEWDDRTIRLDGKRHRRAAYGNDGDGHRCPWRASRRFRACGGGDNDHRAREEERRVAARTTSEMHRVGRDAQLLGGQSRKGSKLLRGRPWGCCN